MDSSRRWSSQTTVLVVGAVAAATLNVVGAALFASIAPYLGFLDLARTAAVGVSLAAGALVVGVSALRPRAVGWALLAASICWACAPLSVGLSQWTWSWIPLAALTVGVLPGLVWVVLAYPGLRLPTRLTRGVVAVALVIALVSFAVRSVAYDPGSWDWCNCVRNPHSIDVTAATYLDLDKWLIGAHALGVVMMIGTFAVLLLGERRSWHTLDATMASATAVVAATWIISDVTAMRGDGATSAHAVSYARDLAIVVLVIAAVSAILQLRPSRAYVADLLVAARNGRDPALMQDLVARALGDSTVEVLWWDEAFPGFRDRRGALAADPRDHDPPPTRDILAVEASGHPVALVVRDAAVQVPAGVLESVREALRLAADNRRLTRELRLSLDQVRESRARIVSASDEARSRIERDLHDGAQQLLVSTGIKLRMARTQAARGPDSALSDALDDASEELGRALARLRDLARGIAPTTRAQGGVRAAVDELVLRSPVAVTVRVNGDLEPDESVASTVFFVVSECLTNVAKHAQATHANIDLHLTDPAQVIVADNGAGGADQRAGTGLRGLADRVEALGGSMTVTSTPSGTRVSASMPLARAQESVTADSVDDDVAARE